MKHLTIKRCMSSCFAAALLISGFVSSAHAVDVDVQVPDNATLAWVSSNLNQSGMDLSIRPFESPDSIYVVFDFYREIWFQEGDIPGFVEDEMGEWTLISQLREEHNIVLQLKPSVSGGSEGFLSIATKNYGESKRDVDFPMPDGAELFSNTFVEERGAQVDTMTFVSNQPIGTTAAFYKDNLKRRGWKLARENSFQGSEFMMFNRQGDRLELVVTGLVEDSIAIYVNRIKRNG